MVSQKHICEHFRNTSSLRPVPEGEQNWEGGEVGMSVSAPLFTD